MPWWTIVVFVVALAVLGSLALVFLQKRGLLTFDHLPAMAAAVYGAMLASVFLAVAPLGRRAVSALGLRGASWRTIVLGAAGTVALSLAASQVGPEVQGMKPVVDFARRPGELGPSFVALALLAPLVEELIFRGLIYGWIAGGWTWAAGRWSRMPERWGTIVAWIASSLFFAAAHYEPAHIMLVLPLGLLFGWLRRRTDSLLPSFVAHVANNGTAILLIGWSN